MIEVEVHQQLRALLREQGGNNWPHQLTVARLVARALRLQRSTLMQVSSTAAYQGQYRLSYLASLLLWPGSAVLVATPEVQQALCHIELPRLREWLHFSKPLYYGPDCLKEILSGEAHSGIALLTPQDWLAYHLNSANPFPADIPLIIDGAENLEQLDSLAPHPDYRPDRLGPAAVDLSNPVRRDPGRPCGAHAHAVSAPA